MADDPTGGILAEPETTTPDGVVIFVLLSALIGSKLLSDYLQ